MKLITLTYKVSLGIDDSEQLTAAVKEQILRQFKHDIKLTKLAKIPDEAFAIEQVENPPVDLSGLSGVQ